MNCQESAFVHRVLVAKIAKQVKFASSSILFIWEGGGVSRWVNCVCGWTSVFQFSKYSELIGLDINFVFSDMLLIALNMLSWVGHCLGPVFNVNTKCFMLTLDCAECMYNFHICKRFAKYMFLSECTTIKTFYELVCLVFLQ